MNEWTQNKTKQNKNKETDQMFFCIEFSVATRDHNLATKLKERERERERDAFQSSLTFCLCRFSFLFIITIIIHPLLASYFPSFSAF